MPWIFAIARYTRLDGYRKRRRLDSREVLFAGVPENLHRAAPETAVGNEDIDRLAGRLARSPARGDPHAQSVGYDSRGSGESNLINRGSGQAESASRVHDTPARFAKGARCLTKRRCLINMVMPNWIAGWMYGLPQNQALKCLPGFRRKFRENARGVSYAGQTASVATPPCCDIPRGFRHVALWPLSR